MHLSLKVAALAAAILPMTVQSAPSQSVQGKPPTKKPNVVIFLVDDVGFGQINSFGGPYNTPNLDQLASRGLRYTNFHTTALCSPTRSSLLTGRNHHSVGMATITETASEQPGYNGKIPKSAGTIASILQQNGYATYAAGKWHLTPTYEASLNGPFDRWPTGMGFDHWYGFHGAETNNWVPTLWNDRTPVEPQKVEGYHLTTDLADHTIQRLGERRSEGKPFFIYFAPGAGHAPHHAPKDYIAKYRGKFDAGWDVLRETTFARQKKMGIIPAYAVLPPRNEAIRAWTDLSADEKRLCARMPMTSRAT